MNKNLEKVVINKINEIINMVLSLEERVANLERRNDVWPPTAAKIRKIKGDKK